MHWLINPIRNHYADFKGRASRKEYWMFMLTYVVLMVIAGLLIALSALFLYEGLIITLVILFMVGMFGLIIPSVAIQVRRLHDIGYSGWWYLIGFIPYIGGIIILVMSALPSEVGTNQYGPNPYGIGTVSDTTQSIEPTGIQS